MTVGNFNKVIGTDGFDSIRGEDLSVVYALDEGDNLNSSLSSDGENPTTILVGGSGDNNYIVWKNSTTFVLESSDSDNILWTTIGTGSGISLEDNNSFVAEIDDRHLYLGNTQTNQYTVVVDWQLPENQIETFGLSEGDLSYSEFADSFRSSSNYRGNFSWAELSTTKEIEGIDLERLGLSPATIDDDFELINGRSQDLSFITSNPLATFIEESASNVAEDEDFLSSFIFGDAEDNILRGTIDNEIILGGGGNDRISGNVGDDIIVGGVIGEDPDKAFGTGGSDNLSGGYGNDAYYVSLSAGGGTLIKDELDPLDTDVLFITAADTNIDILFDTNNAEDAESDSLFDTDDYPELITDPTTFGDSAIEIALPEEGIVGMEKLGTSLIIDLNRDGIADANDDLTIVDFFDESGLGKGSMAQINNIIDPQAIADFF